MPSQNQSTALKLILLWMAFNTVFYALEVTLFNDAADFNNSIQLILWITSMAALLRTKKFGFAVSIFTVVFAFAFNTFNIIYFSAELPVAALLINSVSAVINLAVFMFLLKALLQKGNP
jgi:hypothetical protein